MVVSNRSEGEAVHSASETVPRLARSLKTIFDTHAMLGVVGSHLLRDCQLANVEDKAGDIWRHGQVSQGKAVVFGVELCLFMFTLAISRFGRTMQRHRVPAGADLALYSINIWNGFSHYWAVV